jgi:hypothetical protein
LISARPVYWRSLSTKSIGRSGSRKSSDARLHFGMAVAAEEDALARLLAGLPERPREPSTREREGLRAGVDMVELERADVLAVAAELTRASEFGDKGFLDLAPTLADRCCAAALATMTSVGAQSERRPAVPSTLLEQLGSVAAGSLHPRDTRAQAVLGKPVPDGRDAQAQFGPDTAYGEALLDETL